MQYSIDGRNCELLRVELHDTEGVLAEGGKLIFMRGEVTWNVVLPGRGVHTFNMSQETQRCGFDCAQFQNLRSRFLRARFRLLKQSQ